MLNKNQIWKDLLKKKEKKDKEIKRKPSLQI